MHSIQIPESNLKWYLPSDLSECNQEQYIAMCELIFRYQSGMITYEQLRIQALYKLMKLKQSKTPLSEEQEGNKWANMHQLSLLIDDFFEENEEGIKVIKQYYIHNPIPSISLWRTYYGPADQFSNITFGEYTDALRLYLEYSATGEYATLQLMVAVFYRPKKSFHFIKKHLNNYDGDCREQYNSNRLEQRCEKLKRFPIGYFYGVYLLFASFQKFISTAKIPWGGREIDLSILFDPGEEDSSEEEIPGLGMDGILFTLSESGAFGTLKDVKNTKLLEVFIRLYDLRKRDLDAIKQQKNDIPTNS